MNDLLIEGVGLEVEVDCRQSRPPKTKPAFIPMPFVFQFLVNTSLIESKMVGLIPVGAS